MTALLEPISELAPAGPKRPQRGIHLPQLLLSLLVVAVFALLAVWWQASTTSREPVLALANDVEEGVPLTATDLTEIYISSDISPQVERAEFAEVFVGTLPVADFSAGTFVTAEMFRRGSPLLEGQAFVGLVLDGSRAPTGLSPGDRVQVLGEPVPADGTTDGGVAILSPDAAVESAQYEGSQLRLRLRLDVSSAQQVQLRSTSVVVIEVDNSGPASWEAEEPS